MKKGFSGFTLVWLSALIWGTLVIGADSTVDELTPNEYHDNCFFITNLNHSFMDYRDPYISVHAMSKTIKKQSAEGQGQGEGEEEKQTETEVTLDYEMNVILLNEKDIKETNIKDLNINHCTIEMIKEQKCDEEKTGMIDLAQELKYTVANVVLQSNGANLLVYPILETGWYCTFIKIHPTSDEQQQQEEGITFPVRFEIQQSIGELTIHGYEELETGLIFFIVYLMFGICYFLYNFTKLQKLDLRDYSLLVKVTRFQKVQNNLYKYCIFNSFLSLVTVIRYSMINITSYNHDYVALKIFQFCELSCNTVFTTWIVYEVLLFSDGFNLINNKKNSLMNIITTRALTGLLFLTFIIFDLEQSSLFSIQSYLSDFFKPIAEQNEYNLNIGQLGGWIIYIVLALILIKLVSNTISTIRLLKYRNARLIPRFTLSIAAVGMTPINMFILAPIFNTIEEYLVGKGNNGEGVFYLISKYFVFTNLPFGMIFNFIGFAVICYLWRGADLNAEEGPMDNSNINNNQQRNKKVILPDQSFDDGEEMIDLNKM